MQALVLADLATDVVLGLVAERGHLDVGSRRTRRDPSFEDYLDAISKSDDKRVLELATYVEALRALHRSRNRVQHDGAAFDDATTSRHVSVATAFLREAYSTLFDADFESYSFASLVTFSTARQELLQAQEEIAAGNPDAAVFSAARALSAGRMEYTEVRQRRGQKSYLALLSSSGSLSGMRLDPEVVQDISNIADLLELMRFGVDIDEVLSYFERAPGAERPPGGSHWLRIGATHVDSISEARRQVHFVSRLLFLMGRQLNE